MLKKIFVVLLILEGQFLAHTGVGMVSGFESGFSHPIGGADHILAMFGVGLLAAQMGGRAVFALPISFVGMMIAGAVLGVYGVVVPLVEEGILTSVIVLGALIGLRIKMPIVLTSLIVGLFAVFHGTAHGSEMPLNTGGFEYGAGFIFVTAMLHFTGIVFGMALHKAAKSKFSRMAGGAIVAAGAALSVT